MANNPYVNKVEYAGQTLMDLTGDTVTPSKVLNGETFHDRSGTPQQGSMITHNVYDGLDSTSADDALSAKQGKVLNEKISNYGFFTPFNLTTDNQNSYNVPMVAAVYDQVNGMGWCTFIVSGLGGASHLNQILINNSDYAVRYYENGTWGSWTKVLTSKIGTVPAGQTVEGQISSLGSVYSIKSNITSDGSVTVDLSQYRYIMFAFYAGSHYRQTAIYPSNWVAGSIRLGFDNLVSSSRCYCLKQTYNTSTHVMTYVAATASSGDWLNGSFEIFGIK